MKKFKGKVALITGGASGMGADNVRRFTEEGAKVYFTDINSALGESLAASLGEQAVFIKQDAGNESHWKEVIEIIDSNDSKLDILINNAGIANIQSFEELDLASYMNVVNVNQVSVFLGMKHALPLLKKSGKGSIINISSIAGLGGAAGRAAYSSTKYAVRGLTQSAALEFSEFNIRVNSIHPGVVETPMVVQKGTEDLLKELTKKIPLKRIGEPRDLTNMVMFLASEDSSYCTAGEFVVDGGYIAGV